MYTKNSLFILIYQTFVNLFFKVKTILKKQAVPIPEQPFPKPGHQWYL